MHMFFCKAHIYVVIHKMLHGAEITRHCFCIAGGLVENNTYISIYVSRITILTVVMTHHGSAIVPDCSQHVEQIMKIIEGSWKAIHVGIP